MRSRYARKYDKRVAISSVAMVDDGFGGKIPGTTTQNQQRWCRVVAPDLPAASQYRNDFGLKGDSRILIFRFRAFDFDIKNQVLTYKGTTFNPLAVQEADQYNVETIIVAQAVEDNL